MADGMVSANIDVDANMLPRIDTQTALKNAVKDQVFTLLAEGRYLIGFFPEGQLLRGGEERDLQRAGRTRTVSEKNVPTL